MAVVVDQIVIEGDSIGISTNGAKDDGIRSQEVVVSAETHQVIPWRRYRITIEELEHADM